MDFGSTTFDSVRRGSQDSTVSTSSSGSTTPLESPVSPAVEVAAAAENMAVKKPVTPNQAKPQPQQSQPQYKKQSSLRKNPPIVRPGMSSPAEYSACRKCCHCGTALAISDRCIDCKHVGCHRC